MCFIHIDIFTQSLAYDKHQLENNNIKNNKMLATSAQNEMKPGVSSLPILFES